MIKVTVNAFERREHTVWRGEEKGINEGSRFRL